MAFDDDHCRWRTARLAERVTPLPGSIPYENRRPLSVAGPYDGLPLATFLARRHPHIDPAQWAVSASEGRLEVDGRVVWTLDRVVRAGNRIVHVIPAQTEPDVATAIRFLYEDADIVALDKPAPLPVHPSGRFNKNTVLGLLATAFDDLHLHPVHRLDADTTGVLLLAKHRVAARRLGAQFEARTVAKLYLALVQGVAPPGEFESDAPVRKGLDARGKRAVGAGVWALTRFETLRSGPRSLVTARPHSGRTNQIRVHLAALGLPIVGDLAYGSDASGDFISGGALCLHAHALELQHPGTNEPLRLNAPRPDWASH